MVLNLGSEYVILQCPWKYPGQCSVAKSTDILNPQQIPPTLKPGNQLIVQVTPGYSGSARLVDSKTLNPIAHNRLGISTDLSNPNAPYMYTSSGNLIEYSPRCDLQSISDRAFADNPQGAQALINSALTNCLSNN